MMRTVLLISAAMAVGAYDWNWRETVTLPANKNEVTSSAYAGNVGKANLEVEFGSAGNAKLIFQYSTGGGWNSIESISVIPGDIGATSIWGNSNEFLFRIKVQSDPWVLIGNPGRIAWGRLYTAFDD